MPSFPIRRAAVESTRPFAPSKMPNGPRGDPIVLSPRGDSRSFGGGTRIPGVRKQAANTANTMKNGLRAAKRNAPGLVTLNALELDTAVSRWRVLAGFYQAKAFRMGGIRTRKVPLLTPLATVARHNILTT